jgi:hypothetical protein
VKPYLKEGRKGGKRKEGRKEGKKKGKENNNNCILFHLGNKFIHRFIPALFKCEFGCVGIRWLVLREDFKALTTKV